MACDCFYQREKQNPLDGLVALLQTASSQVALQADAWADNDTRSVVASMNLSSGPGSC
ncbi:hypothetical protein EMIT043CA1_110077 [Pseudomonas brassicacearum]